MKTAITEMFGIDVPIVAFTHCRDVVAAVSKAGGLGVLGAVGHGFTQLAIARALLLRTPALWALAPLLGSTAVLSGCITGVLAHRVQRFFPPARAEFPG